MGKIKGFVTGIGTKVAVAVGSVPLALAVAVPCFAEESGVASTMATAFGTVKTDFNATVAAIAPIGIGITAVFLVWKFGLKFFKSITGK